MRAMNGRPLSVLIVMGVSGCGKTTLGAALAQQLGWPFAEGDAFHPPANIAKMSAGVPLTDEDRWPWLQAIAAWIGQRRAAGQHGVVACSALRRAYRDVLRGGQADTGLVYLKGDAALIAARQQARPGHFMPASLMQSQFDTLEEPGADEQPITVSVADNPEAILRRVLSAIGGGGDDSGGDGGGGDGGGRAG